MQQFFVGDIFLGHYPTHPRTKELEKTSGRVRSYFQFNGSTPLEKDSWRLNLCQLDRCGDYSDATLFNIVVNKNESIRFSDGSNASFHKHGWLGFDPVAEKDIESVKFVDIGKDYISVEYKFR
ncbi:MAG TPA: hypothetical protein VHY08_11100 [Bacillota bacterium]|nr:hypothetical protein [Bacillota bacterium]